MFSLHHVMAKRPDCLLLELFQPETAQVDRRLADAGYFASGKRDGG